WWTFNQLRNLELAAGNDAAAAEARERAIQSYMDHVHAGGEKEEWASVLVNRVREEVARGAAEREVGAIGPLLLVEQKRKENPYDENRGIALALYKALMEFLDDRGNPARADADPDLHFLHVAEIRLLQDDLNSGNI